MGGTSAMGILWMSFVDSSLVSLPDVMGDGMTMGEIEYGPRWLSV